MVLSSFLSFFSPPFLPHFYARVSESFTEVRFVPQEWQEADIDLLFCAGSWFAWLFFFLLAVEPSASGGNKNRRFATLQAAGELRHQDVRDHTEFPVRRMAWLSAQSETLIGQTNDPVLYSLLVISKESRSLLYS